VTSSRPPQLGSVVWVELADAHGFRKVRPAVIVSATADIVAGQPFHVVAITTRLSTPLPTDQCLTSVGPTRQSPLRPAASLCSRG
jgi:hypothetical protein